MKHSFHYSIIFLFCLIGLTIGTNIMHAQNDVTNCKDALSKLTPGQAIPQTIRDKCRIDETKLQSNSGSSYEELKEVYVPIMEAEQRGTFQFTRDENKETLENEKTSVDAVKEGLTTGAFKSEGYFSKFPSQFNTQFWSGGIDALYTLFIKTGDGASPIFPIESRIDRRTGLTFITKTFLDMVRAKNEGYTCASWTMGEFGYICAENPFTGLRADAHLKENFNNPKTNTAFTRVTMQTKSALSYIGKSENNVAPAYEINYPTNWTWSKAAQYCHVKGGRLPTVEEALFFLSARPNGSFMPRWSLSGYERQYVGVGHQDKSYYVLTGDTTYIPWAESDNVNFIGIRVPYYTELGIYGTPQWTDITTLNSKQISDPTHQMESNGTGYYANRVVWYCVYE